MNQFSTLVYLALLSSALAIAGCVRNPEPQDTRVSGSDGGDTVETGARFSKATGLAWPQSAKVIKVGGSENSLYVLIEADAEALTEWTNNPPPWNCNQWRRGPIPEQIGLDAGMQCMKDIYYTTYESGTKGYDGADKDIIAVLNQSGVYFVAQVDEVKAPRWAERGKVLVIDTTARRAWLSVWEP